MKGKDYAIFIKDLMTHYFDGRNDFYLICELSFNVKFFYMDLENKFWASK